MKILDRVWMLVNSSSVIYCIGDSPQDVWRKVIKEGIMGTGVTKEMLREQGYRAKLLAICNEREQQKGY